MSIRPTWTEFMEMEFGMAMGVIERLPMLDEQTSALLRLFGAKK